MEQGARIKGFHDILKDKADQFAYQVYRATKDFPHEEIYGVTSQIRRAALSVVLNIIEGYARIGSKEYAHFLQISFASLKADQTEKINCVTCCMFHVL
jgi:four helix bundle protein